MITPDQTERYPGILRAAMLIALDNGGINRGRSIDKMRREFREWIERQPQDILPPIDTWLSSLSEDALDAVCCGGEGEPEQVEAMRNAPPFTNDLLNDYFNEVC